MNLNMTGGQAACQLLCRQAYTQSTLAASCVSWIVPTVMCHSIKRTCGHKRTSWGCRGCGRIPKAEKLAIIRAKIFNIWAKHTAAFTWEWGSVYFSN